MSAAARQYLASHTSVLREKLFSGAGLFYAPQRKRLHLENASMLLFLKFNIILIIYV